MLARSYSYKPGHDENRMAHEGDVVRARRHFFETKSENLRHLLRYRYEWMNQYIKPGDKGIEVGAGTGLSREFIRCNNYQITDFAEHEWLDLANVDALATPFRDEELDFVVSSNMIHHVPYPLRFFEEMYRILKPGGYLLVQEIHASAMMRFVLRLMRHEGYAFDINVFDRNLICTDPQDLWSANCAIPRLLFDDPGKFHKNVPGFRITRRTYSEFLNFLNSGGVIAKTFSVPLPQFLLECVRGVDNLLAKALPSIFALQSQIVLQKVPVQL